MEYKEILKASKENMKKCHVCPVCDGRACAGKVPGPGGKGSGSTAIRNYSWWREHVKIHMDVVTESFEPEIYTELFGCSLSMPILPAPIGMIALNFSDKLDEYTYAKTVIEGAAKAGTLALTGGGAVDECYFDPIRAIEELGVPAVPTLKPWRMELVEERIKFAEQKGATAIAMDIDSAGLPHSSASAEPMVAKSAEDIKIMCSMTKLPFVVKGVMTAKSARAAADAGAYAIVVSNHGGRVLDEGLATGEVLAEIKQVVGNRAKILVDGGIRTGADVYKALALGADAVLVGRPCAIAAFGGGAEGVKIHLEKIAAELKDVMKMTGTPTINSINPETIRIIK